MPLLDKLFGKRERPGLQPATVPIKSFVQPTAQQIAQQPMTPEPFFRPAVMPQPQIQPTQAHSTQEQQSSPKPEEKPIFTGGANEAPLFIKINQYEEVLTELSSIKADIENFRAATATFETLRDLQADVISIIGTIAKDIEKSQSKLDRILVQMQAVEQRVKRAAYEEKQATKPASITELEEKIKRLREEIGGLDKAPQGF